MGFPGQVKGKGTSLLRLQKGPLGFSAAQVVNETDEEVVNETDEGVVLEVALTAVEE